MRILAIGDLHFKKTETSEHRQMCFEVIEASKKTSPDLIVILGDVFQDHETNDSSAFFRATKFLTEITKIALTYVLVGNHDLKNNRQFLSEQHFLAAYKNWPNIVIVDRPVIFNQLVFCPYVPNGRFLEALNNVDWRGCKMIFAHQEFQGCNCDGMISVNGDVWKAESSTPLIVSGHIHKYQQLPGIIYVGTPMQMTFAEDFNKGLSLFIIEEGKINHQRIELNVPKKIVIEISSSQVESFILPEGFIIKINISGPPGENRALRKHPRIKYWRSLGHDIKYLDLKEVREAPLRVRKETFTTRVLRMINEQDLLTLSLFNSISI